MIFKVAYPILALILLFVNINYFKDYRQCKLPIREYFLTIPGVMGIIILSKFLQYLKIAETLWNIMEGWSTFVMMMDILIGVPFILITQFISDKCMSQRILITNLTLLSFFDTLILAFIIKVFKTWLDFLKDIREKEEFRNDLETDLYSNIIGNKFNLEQYIEENSEYIDEQQLTENEFALLKDKFCCVWKYNQKETEVNFKRICVICLGNFNCGDKILIHPECHHTFHRECIVQWLKINFNNCCPICKEKTRRGILNTLYYNKKITLEERDRPKTWKKFKFNNYEKIEENTNHLT